MYLLDSCICIDFLRGRLPYAYDLMRNSDPRLFKIPAIVEGELLVGVEKSSRPEKARWLVDEFTLPLRRAAIRLRLRARIRPDRVAS
mgnify:CR=1 FL=1